MRRFVLPLAAIAAVSLRGDVPVVTMATVLPTPPATLICQAQVAGTQFVSCMGNGNGWGGKGAGFAPGQPTPGDNTTASSNSEAAASGNSTVAGWSATASSDGTARAKFSQGPVPNNQGISTAWIPSGSATATGNASVTMGAAPPGAMRWAHQAEVLPWTGPGLTPVVPNLNPPRPPQQENPGAAQNKVTFNITQDPVKTWPGAWLSTSYSFGISQQAPLVQCDYSVYNTLSGPGLFSPVVDQGYPPTNGNNYNGHAKQDRNIPQPEVWYLQSNGIWKKVFWPPGATSATFTGFYAATNGSAVSYSCSATAGCAAWTSNGAGGGPVHADAYASWSASLPAF